jgi:protein xylosyltransferase
MYTSFGFSAMERKWRLPLFASLSISLLLFLIAAFSLKPSTGSYFKFLQKEEKSMFVEDNLVEQPTVSLPAPPRLAYLISGNKGDGMRIRRTLQAIYHPRNYYILHLDLEAPPKERVELARYVRYDPVFQEIGNVIMIGKANLVTYRGPTMVATTLHGAAILLKKFKDWDWFINLSASDYPLATQDDILHVFSFLPRDLNFIEHTSDIGWKEFQRAKPIIIDPGLYMNRKTDIFWATQKRAVPTAYRLFTGSAWAVLSRSFIEYTIMGWDNLPRVLLMYYTNFVSSPEGYFHTVICNSQEFKNTTVNHDLHYIAWDNPPKQHPLSLTLKDFQNMSKSGSPFARKFEREDPVLAFIDKQLLGRGPGRFTPGGWCIGSAVGDDPCAVRGDPSLLRPGPGAQRLQGLIERLLAKPKFRSEQCIFV